VLRMLGIATVSFRWGFCRNVSWNLNYWVKGSFGRGCGWHACGRGE
jgi:hypothetical protein